MNQPSGVFPAVFVSHGAPTLLLEDTPARRFLETLGQRLGQPRAIVVVSAHWEHEGVRVLGTLQPETVHDFSGFPAELWACRYPAPGARALAEALCDTLAGAGYEASLDESRGLDHGVWVPLSLMYPEARVPVTQISINPQRSPQWHWRLGRALAGLRSQGVLVLGSGSLTHNLDDFRRHRHEPERPAAPYASAFVDWFAQTLEAGELDTALSYRVLAPAAERAHPTEDHLLPLFTALGAAGVSWSAERVHQSFTHGAIAMDSYLFHTQPNGRH